MPRVILGSQSPRRKEILDFFNFPFVQQASHFDEKSIIYKRDPIQYVTALALGKAKFLKEKFPSDIILTADTIVYRTGKVYNKPENAEEAFNMLSELVGKWHSVFTGVCVISEDTCVHGWEETRVLFNAFDEDQIREYHRKIHWADKAGGYAIQTAGGLIVKKIDGCYYNVMGLPINTVHELLKSVGIELWNHVK